MQEDAQATKDKATRPGKKRPEWRSIAWLLAITITVAILAGTLWDKKYGKYQHQDLYYGVRVVDKNTEQQARSSRGAYLANAMALRDQWRPWALQHKALLTYMLHAQPRGQADFERIYYALPSTPKEAGMPPVGRDPRQPSSSDFTWQLIDKHDTAMTSMHDPEARLALAKYHARFSHSLQENFLRFHDIAVSNSMANGMSVFTLWASGRITEKTLLRQHIPGKPIFIESVPQQITPSYDFLDKKET